MAVAALLFATAVPLHAATLSVGSATVTPGQSLSIPVSLEGAPGEAVASLQFDIVFDAEVIAVSDASPGTAAAAAGKDALFAPQELGRVRVIVFGLLSQTAIGDGVVADLSLQIDSQAPGGLYPLSLSNVVLSDPQGASVPVSTMTGHLTLGQIPPHAADMNGDWKLSLSEVLRVIQFFSLDGLHCDADSEDGYAPGTGAQDCTAHDSDYLPTNWRISISELLRLIQLFNAPAYHAKPGTEDGFAPSFDTAKRGGQP